MKKLKLLLCVMLFLTLAACGGGQEEIPPPEEEEVQEFLPPETEKLPEEEMSEQPQEKEDPPAPSGEEQPPADGGSSGKVKIPEPHKTYYFRINYGTCTVNVYTKDETGNFTVPHKVMVCSTGYATPKSGVFRIGNVWEWLRLKDHVYGHYVVQITGNILFHSVPYLRWGDPGSLEYWEFDKLGVKASQGCIRLQIADAIWVYEHARDIAGVEFYKDTEDPGPLGKPTAPKISDNVLCRDWDPTDPDPENPWHAYVSGELPVEGEMTEPEAEIPVTPEEGASEGAQPDTEESGEAQAQPGEEPGGEPGDTPPEEGALDEGGPAENSPEEDAAGDGTAADRVHQEEQGGHREDTSAA